MPFLLNLLITSQKKYILTLQIGSGRQRFMDQCKKGGLSQQRDVKHKYPIHGLLYGSTVALPERVRTQMENAGNIVLRDLVSRLSNPQEALFFSIDFFLVKENNCIWDGISMNSKLVWDYNIS